MRAGGVVAFPTETVYGLGADAENPTAVRRVFELKGRPAGHPVIVHLGDSRTLDEWACEIPSQARLLAARFWPGPLTLVLKRTNRASDLVTGEQDTVALRVPAHPVALEILRAFGGGVIAPSANRFGHVSATRAEHVRADFGEAIDLVIDGGPATIGVESTILDLASGAPSILRPGAITRAMLEEVLGEPVALGSARGVRAPGTLPTHYAPRARVELANDAGEAETRAATLRTGGERVVVIGAGEATARFARELYAWMRAADQSGTDVIVVVLPPESGLGSAIRDRLERASGGPP